MPFSFLTSAAWGPTIW
ncbi:unnamed protein product, partial [Rotaria sp. Silwood1]